MVDISKYEGDTSLSCDQDVLNCVICKSPKVSTFSANCLHSFCDYCSSLDETLKTKCPKCLENNETLIRNTIISLKNDIDASVACSWCKDNGERTISVGNCKECAISLCSECISGHNRMPPLRNHTITITQSTSQTDGLFCETHPRETLELFCEACGVLTCRDCQLSTHRDHGGHSWVSEKAVSLKPRLKKIIDSLAIENSGLTNTVEKIQKMTLENSELFKSKFKATEMIMLKCEKMKASIDSYSKNLINELNETFNRHVDSLKEAETSMYKIQSQIDFTIDFCNNLLKNSEKDPASLVQLSDSIFKRVESLHLRALNASSDTTSPSNGQCGWKRSLNSRVFYLENQPIEEIIPLSGNVTWTVDCQMNRKILQKDHAFMDPDSTTHQDEFIENDYAGFIDSITEIESKDRLIGRSCAVCYSHGIMYTCTECQRAYHKHCHLPSIEDNVDRDDWKCTLCLNQDTNDQFKAKEPRLDEDNKGRQSELKTAQVMLLQLLVRSEMAHFSSPTCPICSKSLRHSLLSSSTECKGYEIFHRINEIKRQVESNSETFNLETWVCTLQDYFRAIINKTIKGTLVTPGMTKAASLLNSQLTSMQRTNY